MKLYAFSVGEMTVNKRTFLESNDKKEKIKIPVQAFVIKHKCGNVLIDTGIHTDINDNAEDLWGDYAKVFSPKIELAGDIISRLDSIGLAPSDIDYVILTHMHMDHCGNVRLFENAEIYVQAAEYQIAKTKGSEKNGYFLSDWDHPVTYRLIEGATDLFDDGSIILQPIAGHTDGMQIVKIHLPNTGDIIIASDAAAMTDSLSGKYIPRNNTDNDEYKKSLNKLREYEEAGALVICGHDPAQWECIKKIPEYYN